MALNDFQKAHLQRLFENGTLNDLQNDFYKKCYSGNLVPIFIVDGTSTVVDIFGNAVDIAGSGGGYPEASTFASLPVSPPEGTTYVVINSTGVPFINRKEAGLYKFVSGVWNYLGAIPDGYFTDNVLTFFDDSDPTKQMKIEVAGVSSATVRTLSVPNKSGTIALLDDMIPGPAGPEGPQGPQGIQGIQGIQGATGPAGPANTLSVGTVFTGAAGSAASVSITGTAPTQTINFTIPRGDTGATGPAGPGFSDGDKGDITISGGATVLTIDNNAVTTAKINNEAVTSVKTSHMVEKAFVNPVSVTRNMRNWGNILEDGTGTGVFASYDATENAIAITTNAQAAVRSRSFPIDHNKIYRVFLRTKGDAATNGLYIGASAFPSEAIGVDSSATSAAGTESISLYQQNRTFFAATTTSAYFLSNGVPSVGSYTDHEYFLVGANRSINECPSPKGPGFYPFMQLPATATHAAIRLLNYNNTVTETIWFKDISISELGSGTVVTANLGGDITTAGKAILDDADTTAQRATLGLGTAAVSDSATLVSRANHTGTQAWSTITGTPTTLSGYGIGDAVPSTRTVSTTGPLSGGGALSGNLTLSVSTFTTSAAGVVPASGGGTTNFLRADGTWAAPPGGGGGSLTVTRTTITVPANTAGEYTTTVVDASASASSKVNARLVLNGANDQNGHDELGDMNVFAVPSAGAITFTITHERGPFVGPFYIDYFLA